MTNRNARQSATDCGIYLSAVLREQKAWDSVLQCAGSFPGLGFRPAMRRKLSRPGIPSCNAQEAFPAWDSVLQRAGSFPGLGFRPATRRKLSEACDSVLQRAGRNCILFDRSCLS